MEGAPKDVVRLEAVKPREAESMGERLDKSVDMERRSQDMMPVLSKKEKEKRERERKDIEANTRKREGEVMERKETKKRKKERLIIGGEDDEDDIDDEQDEVAEGVDWMNEE